MNRDVEADKS